VIKKYFYLLICLIVALPLLLLATRSFNKNITLKNILQTVPRVQAGLSFAGKFNKAAYGEDTRPTTCDQRLFERGSK